MSIGWWLPGCSERIAGRSINTVIWSVGRLWVSPLAGHHSRGVDWLSHSTRGMPI